METKRLVQLIQGLNNEKKFNIIKLVVRTGEQSITDIRNNLNLSFSTAHKYLNELEDSGILSSRIEYEGKRKKRIYTVNQFEINLNPKSFTKKEDEKIQEKAKSIKINAEEGAVHHFNIDELEEKLKKSGLPLQVIIKISEKLKENIYEGMHEDEITETIFQTVKDNITFWEKNLRKLERLELFSHKLNFLTTLEERGLEEITKMHRNGGISIRNVGKQLPINFHHDLGLIFKHGLNIVGLNAEPAQHFESAASHIELLANAVNNDISGTEQTLDSLNAYLAPYAKDLNQRETNQLAQSLMFKLDNLCKIRDLQINLSLEFTMPKHLRNKPAYRGGKEVGTLGDYEAEMIDLLNTIVEQTVQEDFKFPKLFFKFRNKNQEVPEDFSDIMDKSYIVNLTPSWQKDNVSYGCDWTRLDSSWSGNERTLRTGEMQAVTLNLPRLALKSKNETEFLTNLNKIVNKTQRIFNVTAEEIWKEKTRSMNYLNKRIKGDQYCYLDDGQYNLQLTGLETTLEILNSKGDITLAEKILNTINSELKKDTLLRTNLIESDYSLVRMRFAKLDKNKYNTTYNTYSPGVDPGLQDEDKIKYLGKLHPKLQGGHCAKVKEMTPELLKQILKSDVGLAASNNAIWLI